MPPLPRKREDESDLFASEKFKLIGKLAAGVAHELNNPLMVIQNNISLILAEIEEKNGLRINPQSDFHLALHDVLNECERMSKITKGLLEFSRPSALKPQSKDIETILVDAIKLVQPLLVKAQIHLNLNIVAKDTRCFVKPDQIQQIFINLLDNSVYALKKKYPIKQYPPDRNLITVTLRSEVITRNEETRPYVIVDFYDDGIGIPLKMQTNIFTPFFTTKRTKEELIEITKSQGLGLGLVYCVSILEEYGGFISFESKEGQFTCFHVHIPLESAGLSDEEAVRF